MKKESMLSIYAPDYITIEGSLDDPETFASIIHFVNEAKTQVKVRVGEVVYYVCPGDSVDQVKNHRDHRHMVEDRRRREDRRSGDRRQGDRRQDP
ncbi:MAG: hypothetical protein V4465_01080 [Patescibacteria group bacterium]